MEPASRSAGKLNPAHEREPGLCRGAYCFVSQLYLMPLRFTEKALRDSLAALHLANDGDDMERRYWPSITEHFPNYEIFWRELVAPMTKRIETPIDNPARHQRRDRIANDLWEISYTNYSLFLNLAYAADHLALPLKSSFGNFYGHLGSACDLAEDFLLATYVFVSDCRGQETCYPPTLSKEEFLDIAGKWYDRDYANLYDYYQKKGKMRPLYLPSRPMVLDGYFGHEHEGWINFKKISAEIRPYRNKVVHDVAMGAVLAGGGKYHLVPKKRCINNYGKMHAVQEAANDPERLKRDFIIREEQMSYDLRTFQTALNLVWEKPLADLRLLLYSERNASLLQRYDLELVDGMTNE